ncbi:hypothetical protein NBZ79_16515 [Sneathiella marina]|uniref:Uncharacterized protein n=1 Tax=Sneathiella marina TaxID=2950108 RepID=A0ABY4W0S0_9PROT|nr:hypothetical protein [Sneathiella marina]USG60763.1 hypothetical protein NBZ79_16515 [Sneathiella marina]
MNAKEFTKLVKESITYNQLERYFLVDQGNLESLNDHFTLRPDIDAIEEDMASAGGLKLSHAQRRMLVVLVALWDGRVADKVFSNGMGDLPKVIQSMDRNNRELFAELVVSYPGWGN